MPKRPWTAEEDEVLREHYPAHGSGADWAALLPGRTALAIQHRASDIGANCTDERRRKAPWTEAEIEEIRTHYPTHGPRWDGWAERLPGRSEKQIAWKAQRLKVQYLFGPRCKRTGPAAPKKPRARKSADKKPKPVPTIIGHVGATWTDEQRERLLEHALACVKATGHPLGECAVELDRLISEHRAAKGVPVAAEVAS